MDVAVSGEFISITVVLGIAGFALRNNWLESRKRREVYQKIDNLQKHTNGEFVKKEICSIQYKGVKDSLDEVKKTTACIPEIKVGMDLLLKKNGINK